MWNFFGESNPHQQRKVEITSRDHQLQQSRQEDIMESTQEGPKLMPIEWEMMDKKRFFGFSIVNSVGLRVFLYPLTVVKTRLQVQRGKYPVYSGTFDAFVKIIKQEGFQGLYKGFMINTFQVVSGIGYLLTYEKVRHLVGTYVTDDIRIKGLIGGGVGSLVSQTIITPFDVISQHMMVISDSKKTSTAGGSRKFSSFANPLLIKRSETLKYGLSIAVVRELYRTDGLKGFYRGYMASLTTYVPSSACWWMFYPIYTEAIASFLPPNTTSHMLIQVIAGTSSGVTVSALTNPLDVIRANVQIQRTSYSSALQRLWHEEGLKMFTKGLSARISQSCISSAFIVAGYETLKRWSVKDEYKDQVRW